MNKTFILLALATLLLGNKADAQQTATSIINGGWLSASTWDCNCIPSPGYDVTINTAVTLDTNFIVLSASNTLTINAGGSLIEDASPRSLSVSAGTLNNLGDLNVNDFSVLGGSFTSGGFGSATFSDFLNSGTVQNDATMTIVNLTNTSTFTNNKTLNLTNFTNIGTFTNDNSVSFTDITNTSTGVFTNNNGSTMNGTDMLNQGTLTNNGYISIVDFFSLGGITYNNLSIIPSNNCYTNGDFVNSAAGFLAVGNDYLHGDTTSTFDGVMINNGRIEVDNDFRNLDTIQGAGFICVANNSYNTGWFLGTFDFCDGSSVTGGSVDFNTGLIESGITNCTGSTTCFTLDPLDIEEDAPMYIGVSVFPNPVSELLNIQVEKPMTLKFEIFNIAGQRVLNIDEKMAVQFTIDLSSLDTGCYLLKTTGPSGAYTSQIVVKQ